MRCPSTIETAGHVEGDRGRHCSCSTSPPPRSSSAPHPTFAILPATSSGRHRPGGELRERFCAQHPELHVFHYALHELSKLRSLSVQYATREKEVDDILRSGVMVDLYAVVRQGMQIGEESYSLKKLERHHGFTRLEKRVREGGGSIVAYEAWLETGDAEVLEAIRAYNEEDCTSTLSLRDWLLDTTRPQAEAEFGVDFADFRDPEPEPEEEHGPPDWMPDAVTLIEPLMAGVSAHGDDDTPEEAERRLLAHLLLYHWREGKPTWWRYFDLRGKPVADLIEDRDATRRLARNNDVVAQDLPDKIEATPTPGPGPAQFRCLIGLPPQRHPRERAHRPPRLPGNLERYRTPTGCGRRGHGKERHIVALCDDGREERSVNQRGTAEALGRRVVCGDEQDPTADPRVADHARGLRVTHVLPHAAGRPPSPRAGA
jgi:hypothetical protein